MMNSFSRFFNSFSKLGFLCLLSFKFNILTFTRINLAAGGQPPSVAKMSATLLKRDSTQLFSCENCEILKNTYFEEYLRTTASIISAPVEL